MSENTFKNTLARKRALITGGTRGIGKEIASALHRTGCSVTITGRDKARPSKANDFSYKALDFEDQTSVDQFLSWLDNHPPFDILINNAGINIIEGIEELSLAHWNKVLQVNLSGSMLLTQAVSKRMTSGGRIVNISSIFAQVSRAGRHAYSASKAGLIGFTRSSALDLAPRGILVNAICPGFTLTELTEKSLSENEKKALSEKIPLQRMAQAQEIAQATLFFCSPLNTFVTGQSIFVDGGFIAQ